MKKLNNKGISVVEFIVVFVILMILVFGMMDTIINLKNTNTETSLKKDLLEYKTTLTKVISDDLIKKGFKSIKKCDTEYRTTTCDFTFDNGYNASLAIDLDNFLITYNNVKYQIPQKDFIEFNGTITIKVENKYLYISIPYYEIDKRDTNYGIDIIHPIGL